MLAWIIYFRDAAEYNRQYIQLHIEEGLKLGIDVKLILVEDLEFGVQKNLWFITYQGKEIAKPDFVIVRAIYPLLSRQLEYMGIRVFNNSFVSETCNDKARTYQYLAKTGIKMVDSSFYRNAQVSEIISKVGQSTVIKAVDGHGGTQVFLIDEVDIETITDITTDTTTETMTLADIVTSAYTTNINTDTSISTETDKKLKEQEGDKNNEYCNEIMKGLGSSDVVIQPLTGSRYQDLRVYVIGKDIVAAVLRTAKRSFKSNYSLGGEVCLYQLSEDEINIVKLIIEQFEFDLVGIDFIIGDEGELIFNEIEDVVGSRMLYRCSDINIVEIYLKYIFQSITAGS